MMNIEKAKNKLLNEAQVTINYAIIDDLAKAYQAGANWCDLAVQEMLQVLKFVKFIMDNEDYSCSFDNIYELVSSVIRKYDTAS